MIKTVRLVPRPTDQTDREFRWNWLLHHGPAVREAIDQSEIAGATASFATPDQITTYGEGHQVPPSQDFHGVESIYFPTYRALTRAVESGVLTALDASIEAVVPGASAVPRLITFEETMGHHPDAETDLGAGQPTKIVRTLKRKKGTDLTEFRDYWHNHHKILEMLAAYRGSTPLIRVSFGLGDILDGDEIRAIAPEDGVMDIDGIIEVFYERTVDVIKGFSHPFPETTRRDERNFLDLDAPIQRVVMQEHVLAP